VRALLKSLQDPTASRLDAAFVENSRTLIAFLGEAAAGRTSSVGALGEIEPRALRQPRTAPRTRANGACRVRYGNVSFAAELMDASTGRCRFALQSARRDQPAGRCRTAWRAPVRRKVVPREPNGLGLIVLIGGLGLGLLNGMLVELAQIDSFIATLGTGTIIYAIALWHTEGRQVLGNLPDAFLYINGRFVFGLPVATYYVAIIAGLMWVITERLPLGRKLYAIGANSKAAALNGIPVTRYVIGTFVASGFMTAFAGVLLASKMRVGQTSVGLEFLLPALVGAFLGTTTIKPGRVNVLGTIVGVVALAIGISGLQQLGGEFYVEPMFNGCTLIGAIVLGAYAQRMRRKVGKVHLPKAATAEEDEL
jgi:ribose/xylose/arabinose/galactoside ABC-type transport system permease subunit